MQRFCKLFEVFFELLVLSRVAETCLLVLCAFESVRCYWKDVKTVIRVVFFQFARRKGVGSGGADRVVCFASGFAATLGSALPPVGSVGLPKFLAL